jgi:hypothetical protein
VRSVVPASAAFAPVTPSLAENAVTLAKRQITPKQFEVAQGTPGILALTFDAGREDSAARQEFFVESSYFCSQSG